MIMHGDKKITQMFHGDKEIIRAYQGDSLVFRSKLIEGEDYERKGWLQSNGGFVNLNYYAIPAYTRIQTSFRYDASLVKKNSLITTENLQLFGVRDTTNSGSPYSTVLWGRAQGKIHYDILQDTSTSLNVGDIKANTTYNIEADNNKNIGYFNGSKVTPTSYKNKSKSRYNVAFHIFGGVMATKTTNTTNYQSSNWKGGLEISFFKLWEGDSLKFDLIPVILTKNIPAQFDGNNKARNTGDVGLINLVDGKFYGNSDPTYKLLVRN